MSVLRDNATVPPRPGPFLVVTGPTAVGKTAVSLDLAEHLGAEILSADSRQIYRELTVGTAKPTAAERARIPHHFVDELRLGEPFSAGRFAAQALDRIAGILARGRVPLVVGGSTLYVHALTHGLADIPGVPPEVRAALERRLEEEGAEALYDELRRVDPRAAQTMDATKTQRLVRALEVYHGTGWPLSHYHDAQPPPPYTFTTVVLWRERRALYRRIEARVEAMLANGLVDEVQGLLERGIDVTLNPLRSIGYQEPIRYLAGEIGYDEMVRLIKRNSRRYAKRQLTWLRRDPAAVWLQAGEVTVQDLVHRLTDAGA